MNQPGPLPGFDTLEARLCLEYLLLAGRDTRAVDRAALACAGDA